MGNPLAGRPPRRPLHSQPPRLTTRFAERLGIICRVGLKPWEQVFHNLRASRQTELADQYLAHVITSWLGNCPPVAERHYLKTTEEHFRRAVEFKRADASEPGAHGATGGANVVQQVVPQQPAENFSKSHDQQKPPEEPGLPLTNFLRLVTIMSSTP